MSLSYIEWQELLAGAFLGPHHGPIVFFVDDSEIISLRPDTPNPAAELASAVRNKMLLAAGKNMFKAIRQDFQRWKATSQAEPPPVLPIVAISVLAASRMRSDSKARSTNYYLRLAQTLLPGGSEASVEALRQELREGDAFLDVVDMWRGLHDWIESRSGALGTSTIRDHPRLPRIGYPLSQALVRQGDRMMLTRFFRALDFAPGAPPDVEVTLAAIGIWTAAAQNRLSDTFMRALGDDELRPLLAAVVEAHAQAWDGRVLTSDGRQRIAMRLCIDLDAWQTRWLFPVPPGGPSYLEVVDSHVDQEVRLSAIPGSEYYSATGVSGVSAEQLRSGVRLRGTEFTAEFSPSPVLFLRPDPHEGAWSSTAGMLPYEEHLVAIDASHVTEFREVLGEAASEGWRMLPQRGAVLLAGFALFEGVRFVDGIALELVLARFPRLRRIGVAPALVPRARLVRGLPIARSISSTTYLAGGEPDLLMPSGPEPRTATVTLDGRREELQANGFPLELRRFFGDEGTHTVDADGQVLRFTSLTGSPDPDSPPGTAALGWTSDEELVGVGPDVDVVGALVAGAPESIPVFVRRGRDETVLLHEDGRAETVEEPTPPGFLSTLDVELHLPSFEIAAPPSARWLAQRRGARWRLTEISSPDSREFDLDVDLVEAWKRACSGTNGTQLWEMQIRLAGGGQ